MLKALAPGQLHLVMYTMLFNVMFCPRIERLPSYVFFFSQRVKNTFTIFYKELYKVEI